MSQIPEQLARDTIDTDLIRCGWLIQDKSTIILNACIGVVVREYQTDIGPDEYVPFVNKKPVALLKQNLQNKACILPVTKTKVTLTQKPCEFVSWWTR